MQALITGLGSYVPQKIISNDDLSKNLDTSDEWISTRTGIKERRIADTKNGENTASMGFEAAKNALLMAQLKADELDLIILATSTPEYRLPGTAVIIQELLGAFNIPAFDISAACAGSIYGLSLAHSFIKAGIYKNILLITSESMSSIINPHDRNTAVLFGDGASAVILSATNNKNKGILDINLYADGRQKDTIFIPAGGAKQPIDAEALAHHHDKVLMNGRETFKFAVRALCDATERLLDKHNINIKDINYVVPHQANIRIIEAIAKRLDVPMDRFLINLDRYANTSAASLFLAYDEAFRAGKIKDNDIILMLAIGAGMAWGAGLYRV
jgi:3-oxoacyl-[acyl-carrier-protein] synthase-3